METATESTQETSSGFETFEDLGSDEEKFETFDDPYEIEEEQPKAAKKEEVKEDLKVIKDSQADSKGKVIKEDKDVKEEDEEEEVEEDEEEEDSEEEVKESKDEEEDKPEEKKAKNKLRIRMGNELFNIDSDATFKVKVDGKVEEVSAQDLINNYSGKTAWDKKFTELGKEKKAVEWEKSKVEKERGKLLEHINKAIAPLKDPESNPLESLLYLVEMSGEDPYNAYRRIMEANLEELGSLMDMSEVERELYFHKKKDELHGKVHKQRLEKYQEEQSFNQVLQKVDKLRQAHNVSEEQFVEASEELESLFESSGLDTNSITEETIVDYASLRPHIDAVRQLVEPYEDNISEESYGDVVAELAKYLRDGKADKASIQQLLKRNFSVEEEVKELNTRVYSKQKAKPSKKNVEPEVSDRFETFDDF